MKCDYQRLVILVLAFVLFQCNGSTPKSDDTQNTTKPSSAVSAPYTGDEDHSISLEEAAKMTSRYRAQNPEGPYAWYFGAKAIEKILAQEGIVGIRIYGGINTTGQVSPVVVGILPSGADLEKGEIAERGPPCPPCLELPGLLNQEN